MMKSEQRHSFYLNNLIYHLDYVGLLKKTVDYVIKEPLWLNGQNDQHTLCDLIIGHTDGTCSALELKGSKTKRPKAIKQLEAGRDFIEFELRHEYRNGIFAVYLQPKKYYYEVMP